MLFQAKQKKQKKIIPGILARDYLLLSKMYVVVDMFAAEAVIALTSGAIAKLKVGTIHICSAADRALVGIELALLFVADAGRFLAEIYGAVAGLFGKECLQVAGAENKEVQQRHNRQQIYGEGIAQHCHEEEHRINQSKELHAHGDNEHEQHLHIRIHRRE